MSEIDEIRCSYEKGELDFIKADLEEFLRRHRREIKEFMALLNSKQTHSPVTLDGAVRLFITKKQSINPVRDIQDQIREIEREKWIQGVHNQRPPEPETVAQNWAKCHSPGWRSHRVTSILYVFDREKEHYLSLLRENT